MRPVSQTFLDTIRHPHSTAAKVELIFPGTTTRVSVPVESGQLTIDRTAQNRRAAQIQIPWSLTAGEDLGLDLRTLPLGGYAALWRGIRYGDGTLELIQVAYLRVESVTWETLAASASLELADRMAQVRDEPFTVPYAATGKTADQAAVEIVRAVFGSSIAYNVRLYAPNAITDATYTGSRADALTALEQSANAETYFDANGDFVFAARPASTDPVVWTVDAADAGVMVNATENLDRTGIYNGVLVTGQSDGASPPFSALATFDDPNSPIRWGGPFGHVALIADSQAVADQQSAAAVAQSLLNLRLKQTRTLTLTAAPNPALEAGDTIAVVFPDGRTEHHLIDSVTVDLGTDAQSIQTRSQFSPGSQPLPAPDRDRLWAGRDAWRREAVA